MRCRGPTVAPAMASRRCRAARALKVRGDRAVHGRAAVHALQCAEVLAVHLVAGRAIRLVELLAGCDKFGHRADLVWIDSRARELRLLRAYPPRVVVVVQQHFDDDRRVCVNDDSLTHRYGPCCLSFLLARQTDSSNHIGIPAPRRAKCRASAKRRPLCLSYAERSLRKQAKCHTSEDDRKTELHMASGQEARSGTTCRHSESRCAREP